MSLSPLFLLVGIGLAVALVYGGFQSRVMPVRIASVAAAVAVLFVSFTLASFRYVSDDEIGVVSKNFGIKSLPAGKIIATQGEKGPQAKILAPGWQLWYWPIIFKIDKTQVIEIEQGTVRMITASDGQPLPPDSTYAPPWEPGTEREMQKAEHFLTKGNGYKGPQTTVLSPGKYRINPRLFKLEPAPVLTIAKAEVGVVKSNVGDIPAPLKGESDPSTRQLVAQGQRGIWRNPLLPGQYYQYSHAKAYEVTVISTRKKIIRYTVGEGQRSGDSEESEIMVRTSDGFTFPVDVRVQYEIHPYDAPVLVATVGDDQAGLRQVLNAAVRATFRNNAQAVKALDYVKQRKQQEEQSKDMLQQRLADIGLTINDVQIGDVGDEKSLGSLLKTQTDREIALQEQETFREQQRAAEQKKELTKTEQEAEEEKRLATARYEVQIAEQAKERRIIAAGAEAEAIKIQAQAQADAYRLIAEQIGSSNAALVEVLKIVGEQGIQITPRVMVSGAEGGNGNGQTTALIGTMLDTMVDRTPVTRPSAQPAQ